MLCFLSSSWTAVAEQSGCQDYWRGVKRIGKAFFYITHIETKSRKGLAGVGRWFTGKMLDMQAAGPEFKSPQPMYKFCKCIWPIILACKKHRESLEQAGLAKTSQDGMFKVQWKETKKPASVYNVESNAGSHSTSGLYTHSHT